MTYLTDFLLKGMVFTIWQYDNSFPQIFLSLANWLRGFVNCTKYVKNDSCQFLGASISVLNWTRFSPGSELQVKVRLEEKWRRRSQTWQLSSKHMKNAKSLPDCFDRRGPRYGKNNLLSEAGVRLGNFTRTLGRVLPEDCSTSTAKVSRYQIDLTFGKQLMSSFFLTTSTKNVKKTFTSSFVKISPGFCSFLMA